MIISQRSAPDFAIKDVHTLVFFPFLDVDFAGEGLITAKAALLDGFDGVGAILV